MVVDYKTDRIGSGEAPARAESYREQGRCCAEAVRHAFGESARFRLVFLRPSVGVDPDLAQAPAASDKS